MVRSAVPISGKFLRSEKMRTPGRSGLSRATTQTPQVNRQEACARLRMEVHRSSAGSRMGAMNEAARPGASRGLWAEILALALVYYGVGRLTWLLVPAPGQAAALWPPAGIALGFMLWRGVAVWPGVLLGAGTLALQACLMARALPLPRACLLAAAVGVGATLEPVPAALAVRPF